MRGTRVTERQRANHSDRGPEKAAEGENEADKTHACSLHGLRHV